VRTGAPPDVAAWQRLHAVPFDRAGVQLVSLFRDSATSDMLSRALPRSRLLSGPGEIRGEPLEAIRRLAASGPRGAPLIVLGHAEGSAFRIDGSEGTAVSFEALTRLAGEYGRPLILLGCYTADHFARPELQHLRDYPVAGTLNLMYPRDVVPRLVAAMQGGGSMAGFIETLAAREDLTIWLSNNFLREVDGGAARSVRAPIYKQMPDGRRSIAGFVYLLLPCALGGTCR
jgi:hypothetical protein